MSGNPRRPLSSSYGSTSNTPPIPNPSHPATHLSHVPAQDVYSPGTMSPSRETPPLPRTTSFDRPSTNHGSSPLLQPRHTHTGMGNHGYGRGMTFDEIQRGGVLSADERSGDFDEARLGVGLDEKSIGRMKKKLRPYYTHLAALAEHYREVDSLLAGSLPYTVATSFRPQLDQHGDADIPADADIQPIGSNAPQDETMDAEEEDTEAWLRRNSTWKVRKVRRESKKSVDHVRGTSADRASGRRGIGTMARGDKGAGAGAAGPEGERGEERDVEEVGEGTGLLSEGKEREAKREKLAKVALNVNTIVNVLLVAAKVVAVLYSSSISLTASLVDSALDLLSTFIILGTSWAMGIQTDRHKYPAGKRRFEPLGVLIFSVVMIASFVQVFIEAFQRAIGPADKVPFDLSFVGAMTMVATIGVKTVLWIWCSRIPSSGVQALAQDAENDVMLNIISLSFPSLGTFLGWSLLDPIGGMVLSAYIVFEWIKTLLENFENLSGKSASPDQVTRVLYLVTRFNPVIEIADVECYHIGDDLIVEVDVILPQGSTLHFAHDVGETIHVDYSSANPAQHTTRTPGSQLANGAQKRLAPLIESPGSLPNGGGEAQSEDRGRSPPK